MFLAYLFNVFEVVTCEAYVKRLKLDKLLPKVDKCFIVDYFKETKDYYF